MNAKDEDVVVFTGSGTISAIHKLIHALQLHERKNEKSVSNDHFNPGSSYSKPSLFLEGPDYLPSPRILRSLL